MSKIALIIDDFGQHKANCATLISKAFSVPLHNIMLSGEQNRPLAEHAIFDRRSPEFANVLLETLRALTDLGCHWRAFELLEGQTWQPSATYYEITQDRLSNMVAARTESMSQQRRLADLEGGQSG